MMDKVFGFTGQGFGFGFVPLLTRLRFSTGAGLRAGGSMAPLRDWFDQFSIVSFDRHVAWMLRGAAAKAQHYPYAIHLNNPSDLFRRLTD